MDAARLQILAAMGLTILLAAAIAALGRSALPAAVAGLGAVVTGVAVPVWLMATGESAPPGTRWHLIPQRIVLNDALSALAGLGPLLMVAGLVAILRGPGRGGPRREDVAVLVTGAIISVAVAALPQARSLFAYGPTYGTRSGLDVGTTLVAPRSPGGCPRGQSRTTEISVPSRLLSQPRKAVVQFPVVGGTPCHPPGGFPVLYLLHGDPGGDMDWLRAGDSQVLMDAADREGLGAFIAVYPDGNGPYWTDWADRGDGRWPIADFIVDELVPYIDAHYPTSARRDQRFVVGLSAGGFGAASLGLQHPEVFGGLASYSGYFRLGVSPGSRNLAPGSAPLDLAARLRPDAVRVILGAGTSDGEFRTGTQGFAHWLSDRGWHPVYLESPGGHGYQLWRDLLWKSLPILGRWSREAASP